MVIDGLAFLRRAQRLFIELQQRTFPNAERLAHLCGCSYNTAQRTIFRLRDEYLLPIVYDASKRGYYLADSTVGLPAKLPPGRDEFLALLLARDIVKGLDAGDVEYQLDNLWQHFAAHNSRLLPELGSITRVFSSDNTAAAELADAGVLQFVTAAASGEHLELDYKSPWTHTEVKTYRGRILRTHHSDGSLYLLFYETSGREVILNASFVKAFKVSPTLLKWNDHPSHEHSDRASHWLEGFGIWSGSEPVEVSVHILPPASEYYAAQRWHVEQRDTFDQSVLIRTFPAIPSPELERRLLSLGGYLKWVEPESLRRAVAKQSCALTAHLSEMAAPANG